MRRRDRLGQLPANGEGGVCIEQRLFSNSASNPDRVGSTWWRSRAWPDIGRGMKRRTYWPSGGVSANLTTMTHYLVAIADRTGPRP